MSSLKHAASTWQYNKGDSVHGLTPREPITIVIREYRHGYFGYAHTGDGSKPGSLLRSTSGTRPIDLYADLVDAFDR